MSTPEGIATDHRTVRVGGDGSSVEAAERSIATAAATSPAASTARKRRRGATINPPANAAGIAGNRKGSRRRGRSRPARPNRNRAAPVTTTLSSRAVEGMVSVSSPNSVISARYPVPPPRPTAAYAAATRAHRGTSSRRDVVTG